jgi:hypothetical protein
MFQLGGVSECLAAGTTIVVDYLHVNYILEDSISNI